MTLATTSADESMSVGAGSGTSAATTRCTGSGVRIVGDSSHNRALIERLTEEVDGLVYTGMRSATPASVWGEEFAAESPEQLTVHSLEFTATAAPHARRSQ